MLLPSWCAPRRADGTEVIGTAAAAALAEAGCGRIEQELGVQAWTVRGWLRRLRYRAGEMRQDVMFQLGFIGGADPLLPEPCGSPLGGALSAVAAAAHAAISRARLHQGGPVAASSAGPAWPAASRPPGPADSPWPASRPARAPACPWPRHDTHHNHDDAASTARRDTVSSTPPL